MHKREALVRTPAELDEVEAVALQEGTEFFGFCGVEAFGLEFDAVEFYSQDEGRGCAGADCAGDVEGEAGAVRERAAVGVRAVVGCWGEELGEQVAVGLLRGS